MPSIIWFSFFCHRILDQSNVPLYTLACYHSILCWDQKKIKGVVFFFSSCSLHLQWIILSLCVLQQILKYSPTCYLFFDSIMLRMYYTDEPGPYCVTIYWNTEQAISWPSGLMVFCLINSVFFYVWVPVCILWWLQKSVFSMQTVFYWRLYEDPSLLVGLFVQN